MRGEVSCCMDVPAPPPASQQVSGSSLTRPASTAGSSHTHTATIAPLPLGGIFPSMEAGGIHGDTSLFVGMMGSMQFMDIFSTRGVTTALQDFGVTSNRPVFVGIEANASANAGIEEWQQPPAQADEQANSCASTGESEYQGRATPRGEGQGVCHERCESAACMGCAPPRDSCSSSILA